jgi:hypothetical protein
MCVRNSSQLNHNKLVSTLGLVFLQLLYYMIYEKFDKKLDIHLHTHEYTWARCQANLLNAIVSNYKGKKDKCFAGSSFT